MKCYFNTEKGCVVPSSVWDSQMCSACASWASVKMTEKMVEAQTKMAGFYDSAQKDYDKFRKKQKEGEKGANKSFA